MGYPTTRSAALYLERVGIFPTLRQPVPSASPDLNPIHSYPLVPPPHPWPFLIQYINGCPAPDRGQSDIWPWGEAGELPP
jgi:hypothetical protein